MYQRIILKLSGEALLGNLKYGIDLESIEKNADEIKEVCNLGIQLGIVIGGGNIWRGLEGEKGNIDRTTADYMGMLATVINALALQSSLESSGLNTRVQTAIEMKEIAEPYIRRRAMRHLEKGRVVIFAAGIGNPYFTTDTTAALRAMEIEAEVILKATKVDGVYDKDPLKYPEAKKFSQISYLQAINLGLKIMDTTALSLCMDNKIPIIVFNFFKPGNLKKVVCGEDVGTKIWAGGGD